MYLSDLQVRKAVTIDLAFKAVREALIAAADGSGVINPVVIGSGINEGETYSIKSAAAKRDRLVGLKIGSYWPGNHALGISRHGSLIVLLDPTTGRLRAIVEASHLNGLRTAAADAVAAEQLARLDAATLTVVGAGNQAMFEARALCNIRSIQRILIASRNPSRVDDLCAQIRCELNMDVRATTIEQGCREADILVTVTPSYMPIVHSDWIREGTHIAAMGADQVGKQEIPIELLRRGKLFCDLPAQSTKIGEFQHIRSEIESGQITVTAIGDVLTGRVLGRQCAGEITIFDSSGLALQDLYVADRLLQAAI